MQWTRLQAARGSSARTVPALLSTVAWADRETARQAVDELGDLVCELGFVVQEAAAPTVPFLIELAGAPHVTCKADVLDLLRKIYTGRQWSAASKAFSSGHRTRLARQVAWEEAARNAVLAGQHVYEGLTASVDPDVARAATDLLRAIADAQQSAGAEKGDAS
ncbi:hypothetical protein GCM10009535_51990 [Streptomyces thermocarboxydovorans]|uniref:Uncharacterized protein n=1 Tax=Streptomyces thermocarboxydovorans TaxID=59298 RepID=A0ABP3SXP4_9ACTN